MRLDEAQHRAKIIELLERMDSRRMDMWIFSGITAGVLDGDLVERLLNEEIHKLSPEVATYWLGEPCNCNGQLI